MVDTIRNKSIDNDEENMGISDIIGELNSYAQNAGHTLSGIFGEFSIGGVVSVKWAWFSVKRVWLC